MRRWSESAAGQRRRDSEPVAADVDDELEFQEACRIYSMGLCGGMGALQQKAASFCCCFSTRRTTGLRTGVLEG